LTPSRVQSDIEELLKTGFACFDEVALGGAVGITASLALTLATVVLLLSSDRDLAPVLSLLGNYLFGYKVTWSGMAVGIVEAGVGGFALGWIMAKLINLLTLAFEKDLERRLATLTTLEALERSNVERT
jgi:hypothetical protein